MKISAVYQLNQSKNISNNQSKTLVQKTNKFDNINFSGRYYSKEALDLLTEKATAWWCKKLINPEFYIGDDFGSELISAMIEASHKNPNEEKILIFAKELKKNLTKTINKFGKEDYLSESVKLCGIDYHPDGPLYYALKKAKMGRMSDLPPKTSMYLTRGTLEVRDGYQAPYEEIYQLPAGLNKLFETPPESNSPSMLQRVLDLFKK